MEKWRCEVIIIHGGLLAEEAKASLFSETL